MKKLLLLMLLCAAFQSKAQSIKDFIQLKDSTINRSVTFEVPKGADRLECILNGSLSGGTLTLKLVNPEGTSEVGFDLDASGANKSKRTRSANGEASKAIKPPMPGMWKLIIKSKNSNGELTYKITGS